MIRLDPKGAYAAGIWLACLTAGLLARIMVVAMYDVWTPAGSVPTGEGWVLTISPPVFAVVSLGPVVVGGAIAMYQLFRSHPQPKDTGGPDAVSEQP